MTFRLLEVVSLAAFRTIFFEPALVLFEWDHQAFDSKECLPEETPETELINKFEKFGKVGSTNCTQ